ncbi:MAG: hypothetical protein EOP86_03830 [Verrucomicrobiaceae bacterium]|nr:MAG: hypothetical protein EOP86_03830 [Verrucomicrobiaceae bacterium]
MTSTKTYNLHAGILMTVLVGSALVVHRHADKSCLAGGSYADATSEAEERGGDAQAAGEQLLAGKTKSDLQTP